MNFTFQESFQEFRARSRTACTCHIKRLMKKGPHGVDESLDLSVHPTSHDALCAVYILYLDWLAYGRAQHEVWREDLKKVQIRL